jgi:hypothetical protein
MTTTKQKPASSFLDDLQENTRFDRWIEFIAAIVLSLATLGTAWSGYQATRWNGQKSSYSSSANTANLHAAQLANRAIMADSRNIDLFVEWSAAVFQENQEFADFLFERFPTELAVATQAWLALDPTSNPNAPLSPFDMSEYRLDDLEESEQLLVQVEADRNKTSEASQIADRYVLLTVSFASVLFFGGISGKFKSRIIDLSMLALGLVMFLVILAVLISYPVI